MSPRVIAATDNSIVVLWHQRGLAPTGQGYNGEVLGMYEACHGLLTRAQMFYFDPVAAQHFLGLSRAGF